MQRSREEEENADSQKIIERSRSYRRQVSFDDVFENSQEDNGDELVDEHNQVTSQSWRNNKEHNSCRTYSRSQSQVTKYKSSSQHFSSVQPSSNYNFSSKGDEENQKLENASSTFSTSNYRVSSFQSDSKTHSSKSPSLVELSSSSSDSSSDKGRKQESQHVSGILSKESVLVNNNLVFKSSASYIESTTKVSQMDSARKIQEEKDRIWWEAHENSDSSPEPASRDSASYPRIKLIPKPISPIRSSSGDSIDSIYEILGLSPPTLTKCRTKEADTFEQYPSTNLNHLLISPEKSQSKTSKPVAEDPILPGTNTSLLPNSSTSAQSTIFSQNDYGSSFVYSESPIGTEHGADITDSPNYMSYLETEASLTTIIQNESHSQDNSRVLMSTDTNSQEISFTTPNKSSKSQDKRSISTSQSQTSCKTMSENYMEKYTKIKKSKKKMKKKNKRLKNKNELLKKELIVNERIAMTTTRVLKFKEITEQLGVEIRSEKSAKRFTMKKATAARCPNMICDCLCPAEYKGQCRCVCFC